QQFAGDQTSSSSSFDHVQQQQLLDGMSFQIYNVTFSHHMASVNGIQMHYVIGGSRRPCSFIAWLTTFVV
ncbi:MAG: hypothetical protein ACJ70U_02825, partial [Nitrososphaera sp.]